MISGIKDLSEPLGEVTKKSFVFWKYIGNSRIPTGVAYWHNGNWSRSTADVFTLTDEEAKKAAEILSPPLLTNVYFTELVIRGGNG